MNAPTALTWDDRFPEEDRVTIEKLNAAVANLDGLRAVEITVSGHFARSKIAWKLATYQHALLHRLVALLDAVAIGVNLRKPLLAALAARAFMESFAVFAELEGQAQSLLEAEDIAGLDHLAQNGLFVTRDAEFLQAYPAAKVTNVLTYVDKYDRKAEGFRGHYNRLCELCHPNAGGHSRLFSRLCRSDGTVRFTADADPARHAHLIIAAIMPALLLEGMMTSLDATILKIAELHHRLHPVPIR